MRFARVFWFPGAVHEGNGIRQIIIDEKATPKQRDALITLDSGTHGHPYWEIFAAVCPNVLDPVSAPIHIEIDRERRRASLRVDGIGEARVEPIKNPVTGQEHRARIVLPNGFEFKEAEMGNTVRVHVKTGSKVSFQHENTYAQLSAFDWSNS